MSWLGHLAGLDDASGAWYLFWSGIGGKLDLLGVFVVVARRHNCHERRCWRVGRHTVTRDGVTYPYCLRHIPQ